MKPKVKLNSAAMAALLKGDKVRGFLHEHADPVRDSVAMNPAVSRLGADVRLEDDTTDRAVVRVVVDHAYGVGLEGKYRVLQEAARARGLTVTPREDGS